MDNVHAHPKPPFWQRHPLALGFGLVGLLAVLTATGVIAPPFGGGAPRAAAIAPAPLAAPPAAPVDATPEEAKAEAVRLLGAAGSARAAGDLGIAWELGRQAAAKWPAYAEAQQFVKDVAAQKQAAEAAAQAEAARRRAAAARDT